MTDKLTPEALCDEKVLRSEIGRAIAGPGPWSYFVGDLAIAAELLLRKCDKGKLFRAIAITAGFPGADEMTEEFRLASEVWGWFVWATPSDRCIVCLMALKGKRDG
ncbi:MAG: hypothetical protein WC455_18160 [Dehalococcoidia bacterium]|jgi:hypothetical protein